MIQKVTMIAAICGLIFTAYLRGAAAAENWQFEAEINGIKTYYRTVADSDYYAFKATATIDVTMAELGAALRDVPNYPNWMAKVKTAEVLKRYSPNDMDVYLVLNFPWPTSDRDVVATAKTGVSRDLPGTITTTQVKKGHDIPEKDGLVRLPAMFQQFILRYKEMHKTEITYSVFLEAGGNLPALTVNPSLEDVPYESLNNLREFVKQDTYMGADPYNPVNMPVSEAITESILRTRIRDNDVIKTAVTDLHLVKTTLENGYDELEDTAAAVLREYVKTPYFQEDIQNSSEPELLVRLAADKALTSEMADEDGILTLFLEEGAVTGTVMDRMALFIKDEIE